MGTGMGVVAPPNVLRPDQGIVFSLSLGGGGGTTAFNKGVLECAAVNAGLHSLAERIRRSNREKFREEYPHFLGELVWAGLRDPNVAEEITGATLRMARTAIPFVRDGQGMLLSQAMGHFRDPFFGTGIIKGEAPSQREVVVPYRGRNLQREELAAQLRRWVNDGQIEPSAADKVIWVMAHPEVLDLANHSFAVFGGTAEMGVTEHLLEWGATVSVVDIDRPEIWEKLIRMARSRSGVMRFPIRGGERRGITDTERVQRAGADVLTHAPEIRTWLLDFEEPLTVGHYLYGRGEIHTRLALGVDAIVEGLRETGRLKAFSCLLTPTHVYAIPAKTADISLERLGEIPRWKRILQGPMRGLFGWFQPNVSGDYVPGADGRSYRLVNNLLTRQGPNYAVAKWIERELALSLRQKGITTSANLAMWSWTRSVTQNKIFRAAYAGAEGLFGAEVWQPETSRAMNALSLVYDLCNPEAAANPLTPLGHPYELLMEGAMHGGSWTNAYSTPSIATTAALGHWVGLGRKGEEG